jgi:tetratricopeptide (TPR) repeat protein
MRRQGYEKTGRQGKPLFRENRMAIMQRATARNSRPPAWANEKGIPERFAQALRHHEAGNRRKAETAYRRILRKDPGNGDALHMLGLLARDEGRGQRALQLFAKAIAAGPNRALYRKSEAQCLRALGRCEEAIESLKEAVGFEPDSVEGWSMLGNALRAAGRFDEAVTAHEKALALSPGYAEGWSNLGSVHKAAGRTEKAIEACRRAVALAPEHAELHYNLGNACLAAEHWREAAECYRETLQRTPKHARALANLGVAEREQGNLEPAVAHFREAIAVDPEYADAHWNMALAQLMRGESREGWQEYEWRLRIADFPVRRHEGAIWDGSPLAGQTILLHAEQGLGDSFQFIRFATVLKERGARVILECPAALVSVLRGAQGLDRVIGAGEALPPYDVQAPLLSLPHLLSKETEKEPGWGTERVPYIRAEATRVAAWKTRLGEGPEIKVGLCWQGNPNYRADQRRSIPLSMLMPLARMPGVRLFSLQKGEGAEQLAELPKEARIENLGPMIDREGAFIDSAAILANLDLLITSDTAFPHLAGALGRRVWLLLASVPDWRWGLKGEAAPGYPTMRLFRQEKAGDWAGIVARVAEELKKLAAREAA